MSITDINSPAKLPPDLDYTLPYSLPSSTNREVRISPVNGNNFTISSSTQILQFDIPCGGYGDYIDPYTTYIRYKITYTHAGANGTDYSRLIGSAYSFFNLQRVLANNSTAVEEIPEVGILTNILSMSIK
jgi:hypothetical protein